VIVNLQKTPKDKKAALLIRGRADEVMKTVMDRLQIPIPVYMRQDTFLIHISQTSGGSEGISVEARVSSAHGPDCTMPLVQSVDVSFPVSQPQAELPSCGTDLAARPLPSSRLCCTLIESSVL